MAVPPEFSASCGVPVTVTLKSKTTWMEIVLPALYEPFAVVELMLIGSVASIVDTLTSASAKARKREASKRRIFISSILSRFVLIGLSD